MYHFKATAMAPEIYDERLIRPLCRRSKNRRGISKQQARDFVPATGTYLSKVVVGNVVFLWRNVEWKHFIWCRLSFSLLSCLVWCQRKIFCFYFYLFPARTARVPRKVFVCSTTWQYFFALCSIFLFIFFRSGKRWGVERLGVVARSPSCITLGALSCYEVRRCCLHSFLIKSRDLLYLQEANRSILCLPYQISEGGSADAVILGYRWRRWSSKMLSFYGKHGTRQRWLKSIRWYLYWGFAQAC